MPKWYVWYKRKFGEFQVLKNTLSFITCRFFGGAPAANLVDVETGFDGGPKPLGPTIATTKL